MLRSCRSLDCGGRPLKLSVSRMAHQQKDDIFSRRHPHRDPWLKEIGYFGNSRLASFLAAVLIGLVQMYILMRLWLYISIYTPLPNWFHTLGLRGGVLHLTVFLSDALVNVLFCLPAAYAICKLKPPRLFVYLILAIAPGFIWQYRLFFVDPPTFHNWALFVPGVLLTLLPLPLAALVVRGARMARDRRRHTAVQAHR